MHTLSLLEIRDRLADTSVTAEAATKACLDRIAATEPTLHALLHVRDEALEEARALDAKGPDGRPLWGVPVTVKDVLATQGTPTTAGSRILENFVPFYDAHVVERLREAGAVILGKNNQDEFAMGSGTDNSAYQATGNPWDPTRVPGGSSGGSAASVTACQCYASLGTDTGGSIRQPAALCGCVGLKPTYGRVSRYGVIAYGSSLDQVGPMTRTVKDSALMLSVIAGHDARDSTSSPRPVEDYLAAADRRDLSGVVLGVPREFFGEGMAPEVEELCRKTVKLAEDLGAELVDVSVPLATRHAIAAYYVLATAEASSNLARYDGIRYGRRAEHPKDLADLYVRSRTEGFGDEVQRRILLGTYVLSSGYYDAYYRKAAQVRRLIREDFQRVLCVCDALIAPVSPVPAWKLGSKVDDPLTTYLMDIFTVSLNLAGLPGLAFPVGLAGSEGSRLPVGMQLMGSPFAEGALLGIGNALHAAVGDIGLPG